MSASTVNAPTKASGSRFLFWILSLTVLIIIGTIFVLAFGGVYGTEVDPVHFHGREFNYYRLPFTQLQISPTMYEQTSTDFEQSIASHLPTKRSRKHQWQVADIQYGAFQDYGDAKVLDDIFWIVKTHRRDKSDFWKKWSDENPEIARKFWKTVSEIGVNDAYFVLPNFVKSTQNIEAVEEFDEIVIPELVSMYNDLAEDYADANSYDSAVTLTTLAISHDAKNVAAYRIRATAYDALHKTDLADQDRATLKELETSNR
ncbi:MAG: hypothetical protein KDB27_08985 [Planctomycetales bacterium]|nr:hypothetical protein [Planctomycetales bacterium]